MQDQQNAKQQIVDRLRQATNILVTVQNNPTVDELAAALAFTLMLNKMDKHATAVFSGAVPPAISFLEPQKTFEHSVDSLRDFIIALDKEKADRLRYKVEDDVVKIFITPYRSVITKDDLQFSQGDFNVEVIVALGVEKREDLDRAIVAHGRILHDATVVTINASNEQSSLGAVDWQDGAASSISEMLFSLSEALQPNVLDQQISTALLTGIVAATERFSNQRTTPRVMTMAAQLMASGANQQLIANNLTQQTQPSWSAPQAQKPDEHVSQKLSSSTQVNPDGEMKVAHPEPEKVEAKPIIEAPAAAPASEVVEPALQSPEPTPAPDAGLEELKKALQNAAPAIAPNPSLTPAPKPEKQQQPQQPQQPKQDRPPKLKKNQRRLSEKDEPQDQSSFTAAADDEDKLSARPSWQANRLEPPTMGGTLNATAANAEDDARKAEDDARNRTLLSHDSKPRKESEPVAAPEAQSSEAPAPPKIEDTPTPVKESTPQPVAPAPLPAPAPEVPAPQPEPVQPAPIPEPAQPQQELPPEQTEDDLEAARRAVSDALGEATFNPADEPLQAVGSQPLGGALHPSQAPAPIEAPVQSTPAPEQPPAQQAPAPAPLPAPTQSQAPLPPLPPMPDFNTLPPLPPMPGQPAPAAIAGPSVAQQPVASASAQAAPVVQPAPATPAIAPLAPAIPTAPALPEMQSSTAPAPGQVEVDPNNPAQFQIPGQ